MGYRDQQPAGAVHGLHTPAAGAGPGGGQRVFGDGLPAGLHQDGKPAAPPGGGAGEGQGGAGGPAAGVPGLQGRSRPFGGAGRDGVWYLCPGAGAHPL